MDNQDGIADVIVSIVNTNNRALLEGCLESLFGAGADGAHHGPSPVPAAGLPHSRRPEPASAAPLKIEVFVVDNVSTDGSCEMVRRRFPSVHLICNTEREGFGANHNKVLRHTKGRYYLVLNEDTVLFEGAVEGLVRFGDQHPEAGVIGPRILNADGSLQDSCAYFPTLFREVRQTLAQRFRDYCLDAYPAATHDEVADVEWLRGPCLLVRREALEQVGLFDERFFIFYEEVDLCYRMRQSGWRNLFCPEARIIHFGKQTVTRGSSHSITMDAQMELSRFLYFDKHLSFGQRLGLRLFQLSYLPLRFLKTFLPIGRDGTGDPRWQRRLIRHLLWLTTRRPPQLAALVHLPGGLVREPARS